MFEGYIVVSFAVGVDKDYLLFDGFRQDGR